MNLYVYDDELICGARIVMPPDAVFVVYVLPEQLQNGFSDRQWKLIVEKTKEIIGTEELAANATRKLKNVKQNEFQHRIKANQAKFKEQRRERRLCYRRPIQFAEDFNEAFSRGRMVDVCSGGMSFTCLADEDHLHPGRQIATRFSIPRFKPDGSFDALNFTRTGRVCRVEDVNKFLRRVAIQFAEPLPFKPGEQAGSESEAQQRLKFVTI